ncbi:MAG: PAS domain S-box protein [Deltaproteobacteria bacterium]|nr:PAS domain S-box protein [Deltaproteobacteria bacterium]
MKDRNKTKNELIHEVQALRKRLERLEKTSPPGKAARDKEAIASELRRRNEEISLLLQCTDLFMEQKSFEDTAKAVFSLCKKLTGANGGYVALLSENGEENDVLFLDSGGLPCTVDPSLPMPVRGLRAESYHRNKVVYDNNFPQSEWMKFMPHGHVAISNVLFAPLRVGGKAKGLMGLANKPGGFNDNDVRILSMVGDHLAIALSNSWNVENLERSGKHFRSVAETANEAIISINSEGEIIFWNKGAELVFGYSAKAAVGEPATLIIPHRYRKAHREGLRRVLSKKGPSKVIGKSVELAGLKKDGSEIPVELSLARWEVKGAFFFTSIIRDISERKAIEEKFKATAVKMQQYLNVAGVILVVIDPDQKVRLINKKGSRLLGYSEKSIIGKNWFDNFVPQDVRDEVKKGFAEIMAGKIKALEYYENPVVNRKGEKRLISWHNTLLRDEEGNITGSLSSGEDITERREAEEELEKYRHHLEALVRARTEEIEASEKRYRELLGSVTDYIYSVKIKGGKPVSSSHGPGCITVTGYSPKEYEKDPMLWYQMIHNDDKESVKKQVSRLLSGKAAGPFEHRIIHKSGAVRWIMNTPVLHFDEKKGRLVSYEGLVHDITERKQAEKALRESEQKFRQLAENIKEVFWLTSVEDVERVEYVSPEFERIWGHRQEDIYKNPKLWMECIHKDDVERIGKIFNQFIHKKGAYDVEYRIVRKDGSLRWIADKGFHITGKEGKVVRVAGLAQDVTVRKRVEKELLKSNKMLDAINRAQGGVISEADSYDIFNELLRDFLPLTDSEFGFIAELLYSHEGAPRLKLRALTNIAWNNETKALYKRFRSEGMEFRNMDTLFGAVIKTGKVVISNDPKNDPRSGGLPKGHPPLNSFVGIPFPLKGKMTGIVCAANRSGGYDERMIEYLKPFLATCTSMVDAYRNVLKREEVEEAIRHNAQALEESNRLKDLFIDIIRHDLMNPASLVMNFAEILMEEETDAGKIDIIEEIRLNADKLIHLIKNAAKYSRLETLDKVDLSRLDLDIMLKESMRELERALEKKKMTVVYRRRKESFVFLNKMMGDVFTNLLANAIKYGPLKSKIEIKLRSKKDAWIVSFKDRGPGIADKDKERIFERFVRAAREGDKGYGLGLAIARRIVDLHRGRIWVDDNPEGGSIFSVSLPKGEESQRSF